MSRPRGLERQRIDQADIERPTFRDTVIDVDESEADVEQTYDDLDRWIDRYDDGYFDDDEDFEIEGAVDYEEKS